MKPGKEAERLRSIEETPGGDDAPVARRRLFGLLCVLSACALILWSHPAAWLGSVALACLGLILLAPELRRAGSGHPARLARRVLGLALLTLALWGTRTYLLPHAHAPASSWFLFVWLAAAIVFAPDLAALLSAKTSSFFFPGYAASTPLADYSAAKAALARHDYEAAARAYRDYAQADPGDQRVRLELAQLYRHEMKEKAAAVYWYEKVIAFGRRNETEALAYRALIELLVQHRERPRARALLRQMEQTFPAHPYTAGVRALFQ